MRTFLIAFVLALPLMAAEPKPLTDPERLTLSQAKNRISDLSLKIAAVRISLQDQIKDLERQAEERAGGLDKVMRKEMAELDAQIAKLLKDKGAEGCKLRNEVVFGEKAKGGPGTGDWDCSERNGKPAPSEPQKRE